MADDELNSENSAESAVESARASPAGAVGLRGAGQSGVGFNGLTGLSGVQLTGLTEVVKGLQEQALQNFAPEILLGAQANMRSMVESITKAYAAEFAPSMDAIRALVRHAGELPALTRPQDYAVLDEPASAYSPQMASPRSYFETHEEVITSFDDLNKAIKRLITKTPELPLVWRGVKNADWGLHSHLFRHLMDQNGVVPPSKKPKRDQPYPDEDQMVAAEREILEIARRDWRFDHLSALETFARIQHAGGPTRLIDVTNNPYIAAWFAVESDRKEDDNDARLFALATKPVAREGKPPAPDSTLQLDDLGGARDPFWHLLLDTPTRQQLDWGTGARRRVWVPPAYDPRISAQNAAFVLDGVPMTSAKTAAYFKIEGSTYWRRADLLASGSIYAKLSKPTAKPQYNSRNFAPTFSFRIDAEAKKEIREVMESRFGYRLSYIYPDMDALARHLTTRSLG
jgi:hypothetical protein